MFQNQSRGNAARDFVAEREGTGRIEKTLMVNGRARRLDVAPEGPIRMGIETKVGRQSLGKPGSHSRIRQQLARDMKLIRSNQLQKVRWEFFRSRVTGECGPTGPLLEKLNKLGIEVVIHNDIAF